LIIVDVLILQHSVGLSGGNFLGEYVAVHMDRLRYLAALMAKHLDVQVYTMLDAVIQELSQVERSMLHLGER